MVTEVVTAVVTRPTRATALLLTRIAARAIWLTPSPEWGRPVMRKGGASQSILEGFLADIRGEKPSTRHGKTKATSDEKAAKTRESKTAITQTAEVTTSKISLGKLNAAHAFMNGKTPNGAMNSTVGQLKAYITE